MSENTQSTPPVEARPERVGLWCGFGAWVCMFAGLLCVEPLLRATFGDGPIDTSRELELPPEDIVWFGLVAAAFLVSIVAMVTGLVFTLIAVYRGRWNRQSITAIVCNGAGIVLVVLPFFAELWGRLG